VTQSCLAAALSGRYAHRKVSPPYDRKMNSTPTTEDRVWAVLAHLSALSFGMGILLPVIGWSDQRRKSNYASFQCLQALGYQSLGFTVWVLFCLVMILLLSILVLTTLKPPSGNSQASDAFLQPGMILLLTVVFGFFALYFLLPVLGAIACGLGKDFRYPFLGNRLARYVRYEAPQTSDDQVWLYEDHELRWVAAMGHFSILILLWGMLVPLTAWILQGRHNPFLKFQSIQTLVYQVITTIVYLVGGFLYLFGALFLLAGLGALGEPRMDSTIQIISVIIFGGSLLVSFLLILSVPLLHILGQWAGYRVLKDDNYRYPLIGRLVEKWTEPDKAFVTEDNT
jgi:uncharacterized Tic20 family protein